MPNQTTTGFATVSRQYSEAHGKTAEIVVYSTHRYRWNRESRRPTHG